MCVCMRVHDCPASVVVIHWEKERTAVENTDTWSNWTFQRRNYINVINNRNIKMNKLIVSLTYNVYKKKKEKGQNRF